MKPYDLWRGKHNHSEVRVRRLSESVMIVEIYSHSQSQWEECEDVDLTVMVLKDAPLKHHNLISKIAMDTSDFLQSIE